MNTYQINNAVSTLNSLKIRVPDELLVLQSRSIELEWWLEAERQYRREVQAWLDAERLWNNHLWAMNNTAAYRCAKVGWNRMKEAAPNLDGQDEFDRLSVGLKNRYARFAAGVLEEFGFYDEAAWSYIDSGE